MHCKNIWAKKQSKRTTTYILESEGCIDWSEKLARLRTSGRKKDG